MSSPLRLFTGLLLFLSFQLLQASEPIPVSTAPLSTLIQYPEYSIPATVISLNNSRISARITAEIQSIPVQVGDQVEAGQLLVQLDCTDSHLNLKLSKTSLSLAEKELSRTRSLAKTSNASAQQLNLRSTEYTQARVARSQAELEVKRCQVKAPFTAIVTARHAAEGELAAPGTPLVQLLDTAKLEISAQVPLNRVTALQFAEQLEFRTENQQVPVTLRTLLSEINTKARNQEARLIFTAKTALPGSAGRIAWQSSQPHIASELLLQRDDDIGIFILNDGMADFVPLTSARIGHPAPLALSGDKNVIIDGRFALKDGDAVTIKD